jgi:hypothetical protein
MCTSHIEYIGINDEFLDVPVRIDLRKMKDQEIQILVHFTEFIDIYIYCK